MFERLGKWLDDIIGYAVSGICLSWPHSCDGWSSLIALVIAVVTLVFITLPKAYLTMHKFRAWLKTRKDTP